VRLLQRSTRSVRLTHEGRALYSTAKPAVATLLGAARAIEPSSSQPSGRLRVSAPSDLCSGFLSDVIVDFAEKHPRVKLEFTLTNQQSRLIHEGFDVAVRATANLGDSSVVARKLGDIQHHLYAAPKYLRKFGAPVSPEDLHKHQCIVFRAKELVRKWQLLSTLGDVSLDVEGHLGGDDFSFVRAMSLSGAGIALLPELNCVADEATGRLVRVLPDYHARGASLYVVYPTAKQVPARVRAFRDFLVQAWATRVAGQA
jgi:DNA-binding transcriptional LysR family regulator